VINLMEYRGYCGSVDFDEEDKVLYGKLEFIRDLVTYEAIDTKTLITSFHEAVDDDLTCIASISLITN
jgi:predicted HicB family RNase H-like nuclease